MESSTKQIYLCEEIIRFRSRKPKKDELREVSRIFSSILSNKDFSKHQAGSMPLTWIHLLKELENREETELELSEVEAMLSEIEKTTLKDVENHITSLGYVENHKNLRILQCKKLI